MWLFWIGGGICVGVAVLVLWRYVTQLTLGEYSSRFVGAGFAAGAYFYAARFFWTDTSVWLQGLVPLALAVFAGFCAIRAWRNRPEEFQVALESSFGLAVAVGLLVAASFLFSQAG